METVTISRKYQIVIPLKISEAFQLKPGEKVQVLAFDNRIELIPLKKISDMRGFLNGFNTDDTRAPDRTL